MKILAFEHELPGITREQFQRYEKEEALKAYSRAFSIKNKGVKEIII